MRIFILTMPLISHQQAATPTATPNILSTITPLSKSIIIPPADESSDVAPVADCDCSLDYDCQEFATHRQAQACFDACGGSPANNWSRLDRDRDGLACESLP